MSNEMYEKTLLILKPDCVRRGLIGRVLSIIEDKGFNIASMKMRILDCHDTKQLYKEHKDKSFFEANCEFMESGPVVLVLIEGIEVVAKVRKLIWSIRETFATSVRENVVHASADEVDAEREIVLFFRQGANDEL